jgi:hypothetical protein
VVRELAAQFLALAEKQRTSAPLMIAHRLMGLSLLLTGDLVEARTHQNQAIALYDPVDHHSLATRFGVALGRQSCVNGRGHCGALVIQWLPTPMLIEP